MKDMRLDKMLSNMGYGTRKEVKKYIRNGLVKVNGEVVNKSDIHVDPENSVVEINGEVIEYKEYIYLMMNKPRGVISATFDLRHRTVIDLLDEKTKAFNLFPMGRLDIDTEGLLILTNDGKLAHEILSPRNHIPKTYFARVMGEVDEKDVMEIKKGVILPDGYKTLPGELKILNKDIISDVEITIYEGKFHQIKFMFQALGKKVIYLKRISMGSISLDPNLEPGEYRELSEEEIQKLRMAKGS